MNAIKWLIAQYRIISIEEMEQKIDKNKNKNFIYYNLYSPGSFLFILLFAFNFWQIIYSYEDNIFYIVRSNMKQNRIFTNKMQDLEQMKPLNSKFECRTRDDSKHNKALYLILQSIANIKNSMEGIIHLIFLPIRIPLYIISFVQYLFQ